MRKALYGQWERIRHSVVGLMFHPGQLTAEYRDRQRARSVAPWRLAFNALSFFFVMSLITDFHLTSIAAQDTTGLVSSVVESTVERTHLARETVVERVERRFSTFYMALLTLSVATYTLLVGLTHRQSGQPWGVHAVFALHWAAWNFLVAVAFYGLVHLLRSGFVLPAPTMQLARNVLLGTLLLLASIYLFIAFRRVYGDRPLAALLKVGIVLAVGAQVDKVVLALAFRLTMASI